ncbi:MAG: hypothetical protein KC620_08990, partial [Myxococcales bacterium]|nr:hypothetical protein [Myxococcales bacterium]
MSVDSETILAAFPAAPATLKVRDLMRTLDLPQSARHVLRHQLAELVERGALERHHGRHFGRPMAVTTATGTLTLTGRGFGFVAREDGGEDL